jgi:hypothetical protein
VSRCRRFKLSAKAQAAFISQEQWESELDASIINGCPLTLTYYLATKAWGDLFLDRTLFDWRIRTYIITKAWPCYLVIGKHRHLFGNQSYPLRIDATTKFEGRTMINSGNCRNWGIMDD